MNNETVYYYFGKNTIECRVRDDSISIRDSYLITDDDCKVEIIADLLQKFPWFKEFRTLKDILNEWKVHNAFYQRKWQRVHTKDTDIEYRQNKIVKFAYAVASKLIKEKK